jgi:hypothetical protein
MCYFYKEKGIPQHVCMHPDFLLSTISIFIQAFSMLSWRPLMHKALVSSVCCNLQFLGQEWWASSSCSWTIHPATATNQSLMDPESDTVTVPWRNKERELVSDGHPQVAGSGHDELEAFQVARHFSEWWWLGRFLLFYFLSFTPLDTMELLWCAST